MYTVLSLVLFGFLAHHVKGVCRVQPTLRNGACKPVMRSYPEGAIVTCNCNPGYSSNRHNSKQRCRYGRWAPIGSLARCRRPIFPYCNLPPIPENVVSCNPLKPAFIPGQSITCTCPPNFKLDGPGTITCLSTHTWSGRVPGCIPAYRRCRRPHKPVNGYIEPAHVLYFGHNVIIYYRCNSGYQLVGNSLVTCYDGRWSHTPTCRRLTCQHRGAPASGSYAPPTKTVWYPGNVARYFCNDYYFLNGYPNATCQYDRSWSHPLPKCDLLPCLDRCSDEHVPDAPCQCSQYCNPAHENCCPDAHICSAPSCDDLPQPDYGSVSTVGDVASYTCQDGFTVIGDHTRNCVGGKWSGNAPICLPTPPPSDLPTPPPNDLPPSNTYDSCQGRCNLRGMPPHICDCDTDCNRYSSCCKDFASQCPSIAG